jgi:hypothetical protein
VMNWVTKGAILALVGVLGFATLGLGFSLKTPLAMTGPVAEGARRVLVTGKGRGFLLCGERFDGVSAVGSRRRRAYRQVRFPETAGQAR